MMNRERARHDQGKVVRADWRLEDRRDGNPVDTVIPARKTVPSIDDHPHQGTQRDLKHAEI